MFTVDVDLSDFRKEAVRTRNDIVRACYESAKTAAEAGRDEAKRVGPFKDRTGDLRKKIDAKHGTLTELGGVWEIVSPQPYSLFVEGGTSRSRAYPFMGPAHIKAEAVLHARLEVALDRIAADWR